MKEMEEFISSMKRAGSAGYPGGVDRGTYIRETTECLSKLQEAQEKWITAMIGAENARKRIDSLAEKIGTIMTDHEGKLEQDLRTKLYRVKECQICIDDMSEQNSTDMENTKAALKANHIIPHNIEDHPRRYA